MKNDIIELKVPSKPDYISVVRLATSAIGSNMGLNIDDIEDIKVVIAEACINALGKEDYISIVFNTKEDRLIMKVDNVFPCKDEGVDLCSERELGMLIIESLMDEVRFDEEGVEMIKYVEDGIE